MKKMNLMPRLIFLILAILVLFVSCQEDEPEVDKTINIQQFVDNISADSLKSAIVWLEQMKSRYAYNENRKDIALKLKNKFKGYGYSNVKIDSFFCEDLWQYNVITTLEGTSSPDSICILGAHYDSYTDSFVHANDPGADDNASGVAASLEIARLMKKEAFRPESTIQFIAFAAEELGLFGSEDYANKAKEGNFKIKMMLNADMIAYEPSNNQKLWKVNIMNYKKDDFLLSLAYDLCTTYTVLDPITDNLFSDCGDSYSFANKGYPALFFISASENPYYHTALDLSSNCNFDYCREVVKLNYAILLHTNL